MAILTKEQRWLIEKIRKQNGKVYNFHKTSEELQELALILNQKLLKPTKVSDQAIIEEIGDVIIRLETLKPYFNQGLILDRINYKLGKYKEYDDHKRYKQI